MRGRGWFCIPCHAHLFGEMASASSQSFKTVAVKDRVSIKKFVQENGLVFSKGSGYYQLTKPEIIQDYKKVVARKKKDGSFFSGDAVKEILQIKSSSKKYSLDLSEVPDFDVFVQSTSVNRVLLPGTDFLYEEDSGATVTIINSIGCIKK